MKRGGKCSKKASFLPIQPMNNKKRFLLRFTLAIIPALILALSIVLLLYTKYAGKSVQAAVPIPVRLVAPIKKDIAQEIRLNAWVQARNMVTVVPLVAGIIQDMPFDIGQEVEKDEIVASLEDERFRLQLRQAEAGYLAAKSSWERVEQLYKSNATTLQNREQAKGQFEAVQSQYELARLQMDWAQVKSPISGVVLVRHLSKGDIASPERPLITIGTLDDLEVRVKIPERMYSYFLDGGKNIKAYLERTEDRSIPLEIRAVSPFISAESKNFELVLSVPSDTKSLRPGMYVRIILELERHNNVWTLPDRALATGNRLWYMEDGLARSLPFTPLFRSDTNFELADNLADREYVLEGHFFLREGVSIQVIP